MNEFLTRLCAFLKDFPDQQISIPFGDGELYVMYRGPESNEDQVTVLEDPGPGYEGLRMPCSHTTRTMPPEPSAPKNWLTGAEYGKKYGFTPQKVGRMGRDGLIERRDAGKFSKQYHEFLDKPPFTL